MYVLWCVVFGRDTVVVEEMGTRKTTRCCDDTRLVVIISLKSWDFLISWNHGKQFEKFDDFINKFTKIWPESITSPGFNIPQFENLNLENGGVWFLTGFSHFPSAITSTKNSLIEMKWNHFQNNVLDEKHYCLTLHYHVFSQYLLSIGHLCLTHQRSTVWQQK